MHSYTGRLLVAFCFSLSLPLLSLKSYAADMISVESLANPQSAAVAASNSQTTDLARPAMPVITRTSLENQDFSNEDSKRQLQQLLQAQQAMMSQIQTLQARIDKDENQTNTNTQQINTVVEQTDQQSNTLTNLSKRAQLHGYVEGGWRTVRHAPRSEEFLGANGRNENTFDLRRVYLIPTYQFTDKAGYFGEIEFEDAGHDEVGVEESEFYYNWKPWLSFRTGMLVPPLTPTAYLHKSTERYLVDRPLMDSFVIPTTYNDLGAGLYGTIPVLKKSAINYDLMVLNGFKDTIESDAAPGQRLSTGIGFEGLRPLRPGEDTEHLLDNNNNKAVLGRIGFVPFPGLEIGGAAHVGTIDANDSKTLAILTGNIKYRYKKFSALGEYANALFERGSGLNSQGIPFSLFPTSTNGYYTEAAYDITDKLSAATAYNHIDLDEAVSGNSMWRWSAGLRYNPFGRVFLKTEYQLTSARSLFPQEHFSNALLTQLTFDF